MSTQPPRPGSRIGRRLFFAKGAGTVGSGALISGGMYNYERALELRGGRQRYETYRKMSESDPNVAEVLRSLTLPLLARASWSVLPGDKDDKTSVQAANLVSANLYQDENDDYGRDFWMRGSWSQRLREILKMLRDGFAVFYKERVRVESSQVFRRLVWLEPETIQRWVLNDDDTLQMLVRSYTNGAGEARNEELDAADLALYVWDLAGARYEGIAMLRSMYGAWWRKDFFNRCKMIASQRAAVGIPWAKYDGNTSGDINDDLDTFLQQSLASGLEGGYGVFPEVSLEMGYLQQDPAQLEKYNSLTADENMAIAHGGSTKVQQLGETAVGAKAVGDSQNPMQWVVIEAIGQIVAEQELLGVGGCTGVVTELVDLNFENLERYPYVVLANVDPDVAKRDLPLIYDAVGKGLLPNHPLLKQEIAKRLGLDLPDEVFEEEATPLNPTDESELNPDGSPKIPQDPTDPSSKEEPPGGDKQVPGAPTKEPKDTADGIPAEGDEEPEDEEQAGAKKVARRFALQIALQGGYASVPSKKGYGREPTFTEQVACDAPTIALTMTDGEARFAAVLKRINRGFITDLTERFKKGKIDEKTLATLRRTRPKNYDKSKSEVTRTYTSLAATGREHVVRDLEQQRKWLKQNPPRPLPSKQASASLEGKVPLGGKTFPSKDWSRPMRSVLREVGTEATAYAELAIDQMWNRLLNEASRDYMTLWSQGVPEDQIWQQIEASLSGLSDTPVEQLGRQASTVAYSTGRDAGAMEALGKGEAAWALRSELLDNATCDVCDVLDGSEYEIGSPDYYEYMPPAYCEGGANCRGFYVILDPEFGRAVDPSAGPAEPEELPSDTTVGTSDDVFDALKQYEQDMSSDTLRTQVAEGAAFRDWKVATDAEVVSRLGGAGSPDLDAFSSYLGADYRTVNGYLRGELTSAAAKARADAFDRVFEKGATALSRDLTVVRGAAVEAEVAELIIQQARTGSLQFQEYLSTTVDPSTARAFAGRAFGNQTPVIFELFVKKGTRSLTSLAGEEAEVVLQRGARVRVTEIVTMKNSSGETVAVVIKGAVQ